ncbi:MAG: diversity-generating retroelement protein Avd [Ideonella sp.]|nr:diversity-generating retroelement protein Avd [Ideonella sp.]
MAAPEPDWRGPDAPHAARGGAALERMVLFITWLVPVVENFPRSQRFLLGDRLQTLALDTVEGLVEATYRKVPRAELLRVNLLLEKQRLLWRVAYSLKHADPKRYEHACAELDEVGRRVGAWVKRLGAATA